MRNLSLSTMTNDNSFSECIKHQSSVIPKTLPQIIPHACTYTNTNSAFLSKVVYDDVNASSVFLREMTQLAPWNYVLLESPLAAQTFYGNRRFITVFTRAKWIQSTEPNSISLGHILISSYLSGFPITSLHALLVSPCVLHALPNSSSSTRHSNYTWRRAEVKRLPLCRFFCRFIPLRCKYSPQQPLFKYLQSTLFPC
jgi:hypothetical protein